MCIVNLGGCTDKLAKDMNCMCNIRSGGSKVDEATNKMSILKWICKRSAIGGRFNSIGVAVVRVSVRPKRASRS